MTIDIHELREKALKATPGPWEVGDVWLYAGEMPEKLGDGKCAFCPREGITGQGEPLVRKRMDINGKMMMGHKHRSREPYLPDHMVSNEHGPIIGNYDYEVGGVIEPEDTTFIAACDPQTILSLLDVAENASVLLKELDVSDDTQECFQALAALSESLVAIGAYQQD